MFSIPQLSPLEYVLLSVIGSFLITFIKSQLTGPKETISALSARLSAIEAAHHALALKYEGNHNRHDEALETLEANVSKLTDAVNRLCIQMAKTAIL